MDIEGYNYAASLAARQTKEAIVGVIGLVIFVISLYLLIRVGTWGWHKLHEIWPRIIPDRPDLGL